MKQNIKFLLTGLVAAFVLGSCAKEKDKLDKNLVKSEWKVKDFQTVNTETTYTTYVDATPNVVEIEKDSSYFIGNENYDVSFESIKIDGLPEVWERTTYKYEAEQTFNIKEGGLVEIKSKTRRLSRLEEFSNAPSNNTNYNESASTSATTASWSWGNTDEVKTQFIISQGFQSGITFDVIELTKNDFIISMVKTSTYTSYPDNNTTVKRTERMKYYIHFTH